MKEAEKRIEAETEVAIEALIPLKTSDLSRENTNGPAQGLEDGELEDGETIDSVKEQIPHINVSILNPDCRRRCFDSRTRLTFQVIQVPSSLQPPVAHKSYETSHTTALSESVADAAHILTSKGQGS